MAALQPGHQGKIGTAAEHGVPENVDVVVIGSGGAGLSAALTAAKDGPPSRRASRYASRPRPSGCSSRTAP